MGNKPKKTVIILAETPETQYIVSSVQASWRTEEEKKKEVSTSEFVKQAHWWKNKHKEFNVIVMPFYRQTHESEYSLENAIPMINSIAAQSGGKVTIGFMGHSGDRIGGYPFDEHGKELRIRQELNMLKGSIRDKQAADHVYSQTKKEMKRIGIEPKTRLTASQKWALKKSEVFKNKLHQHAYMDLVGYKVVPEAERNERGERRWLFMSYTPELDNDPPFDRTYIDQTGQHRPRGGVAGVAERQPRTHHIVDEYKININEERGDAKEEINDIRSVPLLSDILNPISDKIEGIMIGACSMGECRPFEMQGLSNSLGVPVYAQSGTSWGTGAIETIGEEPYEKFFVVGKHDAGMKYIPWQSAPTAMIRSTDPAEKAWVIGQNWINAKKYARPYSDYPADLKKGNKALSIETGLRNVSDMVFDMLSQQGASPLGF